MPHFGPNTATPAPPLLSVQGPAPVLCSWSLLLANLAFPPWFQRPAHTHFHFRPHVCFWLVPCELCPQGMEAPEGRPWWLQLLFAPEALATPGRHDLASCGPLYMFNYCRVVQSFKAISNYRTGRSLKDPLVQICSFYKCGSQGPET